MKRVTRPGGTVAGCQWDFAKMPVIAALLNGLAAVDPDAHTLLLKRAPQPYQGKAKLAAAWKGQGFSGVAAERIKVTCAYADFDDLWGRLQIGSTPSTLTLAALSEKKKNAVRALMRTHLAPNCGAFSVTAEALAVRGIT